LTKKAKLRHRKQPYPVC